MSSTSRDGRGRVRLLGVLGIGIFAVLYVRLFWIQVIERKQHEDKGRIQHMERVRILPARGSILDRNGSPLAYSVDNPVVIAEPRKLTDSATRREVARKLSRYLHMTVPELETRISRSKAHTVTLNQKPTHVMVEDLKALNLPGIRIEMEPKRVYALNAAAAHVTGFVGVDQEGIEGTERAYDAALQGTPGWVTLRRDAHGGRHSFEHQKPPVAGNNLVLTIDSYLQEVTSNRLNEAVEKCKAKGGWAIVMDPQTGDILAMANAPTYDPTFYDKFPRESYRNHVVSDRIEPGSTIKAITVAAALEEGLMRPETPVNCMNGRWELQGRPITDHEKFDVLPFIDTFAHSSNIAMAQVGLKLGPDRLYHYLKKFGFGEKTGLGLPGEEAGFLRRTEQWSARTPATIAFGYEIQLTALQLALAYAALANDGILMKPRLVKEITAADGSVVERFEPEEVRRVVTQKTARTLLEFMARVVTDGSGKAAALGWCAVGGKTGTARKYDNKLKTYVHKHYASFIGVAPLDQPRLLCYIVIDEPKGNIYGGSTAAPAFREIIEAAGKSPRPIVRPDFPVVTAEGRKTARPRTPSRIRAARWVDVAEAAAETSSVEPDTVVVKWNAEEEDSVATPVFLGQKAPDLRKLALREALLVASQAGFTASFTNQTGVVVRQHPAPGHRAPLGESKIVLFLGAVEELEKEEEDARSR